MSAGLLVTGGTLVTCDEADRVLEGGAVWARDGVLVEVADGPGAAALAERAARAAGGAGLERIDARGCVVLPGLVNAHTHLYSAFARGIALAGPPPKNFLEVLQKLWWRLDRTLDPDDVYFSALVGAIDSAKAGTTTLVDHHASPSACPGSLSAIRDALDLVGLRGVLAYEVSDRDGKGAEGVAENVRFIDACRRARDGRFAGLFGLHASFTIDTETMGAACEAAEGLGVPFHVHVAEDPVDGERTRLRHGAGAVRRLADAGVLREGTVAAHCIHLEPGDREILVERGVVVAHCPQSNTNNAVGTADLFGLLAAGVPVVLGTDGFTPSVLHEAQVGTIVHHLARRHPSAGFAEVASLALRANPALAGLRLFEGLDAPRGLGRIAPGFAADLAIFRYDPPTPLARETLAGHLLFGLHRAPAVATVVAGRVVQKDGAIVGLDEERMMAEARERARAVWRRFAEA